MTCPAGVSSETRSALEVSRRRYAFDKQVQEVKKGYKAISRQEYNLRNVNCSGKVSISDEVERVYTVWLTYL